MKKIIIIFLVILLCGCQTTNNHKVKTVKKTQDYQQLSKYEIIDFKIIDHNLIFVYKKNNQTYVYDYYDKKYICILNYGNVVMRTDPIFLSFGLFLPSSLNRYDGDDGITLPQR